MALSIEREFMLCCFVLMSTISIITEASSQHSQRTNSSHTNPKPLLAYQADDVVSIPSSNQNCFIRGTSRLCQSVPLLKGEAKDYFHICPKDHQCDDSQICYITNIQPCCEGVWNDCKSTSNVLVQSTFVNVTFYNLHGTGISKPFCFVAKPAIELCDRESYLQCLAPNGSYCEDNLEECDSNWNCVCKEGYQPNDCCDCAVGNATHGWYVDDNRKCLSFCRDNCDTKSSGGPCTTCYNGYEPPDCCSCPSNKTEVDKEICKCKINLVNDTCKEGSLDPDCCECDTVGNDTHAFYKGQNGECLYFCKSKCDSTGDRGCLKCKAGYVKEPTCCQCEGCIRPGPLIPIWSIVLIVIGILLLLACLLLLLALGVANFYRDRRDYKRFIEDRDRLQFGVGENPVYTSPIREYQNVTYRAEGAEGTD